MKNKLILLIFGFSSLFLVQNIFAQQEPEITAKDLGHHEFKHAINACPGGIAFGIFSVNYEHLFNSYHGLMGRVDYEAIPKSYTDADIESNGVAVIVNYRYHFSGELKSIFLGSYLRFRTYTGSGRLESTEFDFTIPELTLGLNLGKRWVWDSGFNITFALGYGFSEDWREANPTSNLIKANVDQFTEQYDFFDPFLGEFSLGYAF